MSCDNAVPVAIKDGGRGAGVLLSLCYRVPVPCNVSWIGIDYYATGIRMYVHTACIHTLKCRRHCLSRPLIAPGYHFFSFRFHVRDVSRTMAWNFLEKQRRLHTLLRYKKYCGGLFSYNYKHNNSFDGKLKRREQRLVINTRNLC